jgi:hypothetical protein
MPIPGIIASKQPDLDNLAKKFRVKKLYLFGSATKEQHAFNDIDFLVRFDQVPLEEYADNYFDFLEALENLFNTKVDLVVEDSLKNPYLIDSINRSRIPLYG